MKGSREHEMKSAKKWIADSRKQGLQSSRVEPREMTALVPMSVFAGMGGSFLMSRKWPAADEAS
ncbi:hypothetical protein J2TS6_53170 [Paenibacillus albilobatus]|uniref:Uncharacterized protein n=1 Tax=Paenibacillus albilobatus TaxID=2716884 RepID=A0A919XJP2_9BACL|nr:hypothetical protein J2TS6_53170 [Paenibacillus albilobatus]